MIPAGPVIAAVAINIPNAGLLEGEWKNQVTTPHSLGVNAFVDVDPTVGAGSMFTGAFYGYYDLDNGLRIRPCHSECELNSESGPRRMMEEQWIISDDGVRGGTYVRSKVSAA